MKALILKYLLLCLVILSCSDFSDYTENEAGQDLVENPQNTAYDTPIVEEITENVIQEILGEFSLLAVLNPNRTQNINAYSSTGYSTKLSQTRKHELNEITEIDCQHIVENTFNNIDYTTDQDNQDFLNSNVVSITDSVTKYFTVDMVPSTDCETEEYNGPTPNHDEKDALFRPHSTLITQYLIFQANTTTLSNSILKKMKLHLAQTEIV